MITVKRVLKVSIGCLKSGKALNAGTILVPRRGTIAGQTGDYRPINGKGRWLVYANEMEVKE